MGICSRVRRQDKGTGDRQGTRQLTISGALGDHLHACYAGETTTGTRAAALAPCTACPGVPALLSSLSAAP